MLQLPASALLIYAGSLFIQVSTPPRSRFTTNNNFNTSSNHRSTIPHLAPVMNNTSVDGPSLGPPDLPYTPYHPPHMDNSSDANRRYLYSNGPTPARGQSPVPAKRSGSVSDDGNRSRNAKAQRRHREKRKAQLRLVSFILHPIQIPD